jgi:hypothetical protein
MKRALISVTGFPTDIANPGEEFEIYTGPGSKLRWVDAPDEVTLDWKLEFNEWVPDQGHVDPHEARVVGYGSNGAQFARLFDDIKAGLFGEAAKEGKFFRAVQSVKDETIAKYGELEYDENGQPVDKYKPWAHNDLIPAWMTREEAEAQYPDLVNDTDYKLYVENVVEGDGCPFDPNQEPILPRDAMPEWN